MRVRQWIQNTYRIERDNQKGFSIKRVSGDLTVSFQGQAHPKAFSFGPPSHKLLEFFSSSLGGIEIRSNLGAPPRGSLSFAIYRDRFKFVFLNETPRNSEGD